MRAAMQVPPNPTASLKSLEHGDLELGAGVFEGWEMEYVQISRGVFAAATEELLLPGLQIFLERTSVRTHQFGLGRPGCLIIGIPLRMPDRGRFNGRGWDGEICLARTDREIDSVVPAMDLLVVALDLEVFAEYLLLSEGMEFEGRVAPHSVQIGDPMLARQLGHQLHAALVDCRGRPQALDAAPAQQALRTQVHDLLLPLLLRSLGLRRPSLGEFSRLQLVRRAREYILAHIDTPLQVLEVCRALRVSRRALQYSFQEVLGVNPVTWTRMLRLSGARKELQHGDPATMRVTEILGRWGLWHLGRSSAEYRALFGERPSQTLRARHPDGTQA